ncbi:MAG: hypothetical protein ACJ72D_00625 [Marmoricola sp.]
MVARIGSWLRAHLAISLVIVVGALLLVGALGWLTITTRTGDGVSATWKPACTEGTLTTRNGAYVLRSLPNWSCTLTVTIRNASDRSVHVSAIRVPFLGTRGGAEIEGRSNAGARIRDEGPGASGSGSVDGIYDLDAEVRPHSSYDVRLSVGWRSSGCSGATTTVHRWPVIVFDTLHRTFHRGSDQNLILAPGSDAQAAPGCTQPPAGEAD